MERGLRPAGARAGQLARSARALGSFLVVPCLACAGAGVAAGQMIPPQPPPRSERAAAAARAADPLAALGALAGERQAGAEDRLAAELALADALARAGRRSEAAAAWRTLLAAGIDCASELLALEGARLSVSLAAPPEAGAPLQVSLEGGGSGPVQLALYQVDAPRLRQELSSAPRGLFALLRAPPPATLRRLAAWGAAAPSAGAPIRSVSPEPLPRGLYLLVVEARGVARPCPLSVPSAAWTLRRGAGEGLLWVVERGGPQQGEPLSELSFRALDRLGYPQEELGETRGPGPEAGLLPYPSEAPWACAWRLGSEGGPRGGLVLVELLASRPPPRPPLAAWLSEGRLQAGERLAAWSGGRGGGDPRLVWELLAPGGQVWASRRGEDFALRLPPWAPPGTWVLSRGGAERSLSLGPAAAPEARLEVELVRGAEAWRVELQGALAGGYALAGAEVTWRARLHPAAPVWEPAGLRPQPLHAPRLLHGPGKTVAEGRVVLDAEGRASLSLPREDASWALLSLEAELWGGRVRAHTSGVAGPAQAIGVSPERALLPARAPLPVTLRWIDRAGEGLPRPEFRLVLRDEAGQELAARELRGDESGRAKTSFSLDLQGRVLLEARIAEGVPHEAGLRGQARVWLEDPEGLAAPSGAPPRGIELLLAAALPGSPARALARFPRAGFVLRTRERATLLDARVLRLRRPQLAWDPEPEGRLVLQHFAGEWLGCEEPRAQPQRPLEVRVSGGVAAVGSALSLRAQVRSSRGPEPAALMLEVYRPEGARWRDRLPGEAPHLPGGVASRSDPAPLASGSASGADALAADSRSAPAWVLPRPVFVSAGHRAPSGRLELEVPAGELPPGRYWARVEAIGAGGEAGGEGEGEARGVGWTRCEVAAPWELRLSAPDHLVVGDASELVLELSAATPAETLLRWEAPGLALGEPRLSGLAPRLGVDPGRRALALGPGARGRLRFPIKALQPGSHELSFLLQDARGHDLVSARARLEVRPRGLVWWRAQSGAVPAKGRAQLELDMPRGVVPSTARLEATFDPEPLTALLAGLERLEAHPGSLRAPLEAALIRQRLPEIALARRLAHSPPQAPWRIDELLQRAAALWESPGAWGSLTPDLAVALARLQARGLPVSTSLLRGPWEALAAQEAAAPGDARAAFALRLGRRAAAFPATPSGALYAALAAAEAQGPLSELPDALVAEALAAEPHLEDPLERAELLAFLAERGIAPALEARLLEEVLSARSGPGWDDPALAGAALRALAALALRPPPGAGPAAQHLELPSVGFSLLLEGRKLYEGWAGAGLERWPGPLRLASTRFGPGSRLQLRSRETREPVRYALRAGGVVREEEPAPRREGLGIARALSAAQARVGQRLRLVVRVEAAEGAAPLGSRGLRLELPLPGGCRPFDPLVAAEVREGVLYLDARGPTCEVELLAAHPGTYRLLPARAWARGGWGTSDEATLEVLDR